MSDRERKLGMADDLIRDRNQKMNLVMGVAANIMTAVGMDWEREVAPLCFTGGDFDEMKKKWDAANREAHNRIAARLFPEMVAGFDPWPSIASAVPQTYGEALALWGPDVLGKCEPHEWDNRTTNDNMVWLLCRLHVRRCLERIKELPSKYEDIDDE